MKLTDKTDKIYIENSSGPGQIDEINWRTLQVDKFMQLEQYLHKDVAIASICLLKKEL